MMTAIRKRAPDFIAILFLVIVAVVVGGYILKNQRLRFPFIEEKPRERSRTSMFHAVSATGPIVSFSLDLKTNELVSILFHPNSGYALDEKQLRQLPEAPIRAR